MSIKSLIEQLTAGFYNNHLADIYGDSSTIEYQIERYISAINSYASIYGDADVEVYSAPGRTEIGGNHTDHQHGQVLAAAVELDSIAVVSKTDGGLVRITSEGYDEIVISVAELQQVEAEKETTKSLVKGVLAGIKNKGYAIGGFNAYITSDVLIGAGLSSSAAFETLIGTIVSGLYNDMSISPVDIAIIGQYAENEYFGKPCGLMDQMASSVGNLVHINFADPKSPVVDKIDYDMAKSSYSLCITHTKGSHEDLTPEYAAVPSEMKAVARYFAQEVLIGITEEMLLENISHIRRQLGDRAVLRALHFVAENKRVEQQVNALKANDINTFLKAVKDSGDSSYKYLQNVYSSSDVTHQNMSIALAFSDTFLGDNGVSRVHGGGFAGTIQAFVRNDMVDGYIKHMDSIFGANSCTRLTLRRCGGVKVI